MLAQITSLSWWEAAGQRAAATALAALLPLVLLLVGGQVTVVYVLLVVALAVVASLSTSLAGLPEITDRTVAPWLAILTRVIKSAAQVLVSSVGGAVLLTDVHWPTVGTAVAGAALTTLVRTLMVYLPESTPDGAAVITSLPADTRASLSALAGALDEGDPARVALERIGVTSTAMGA